MLVGLTDQTFTCKTHSGAPRLSGAPLAATNVESAGASCKRRDAVRLGSIEAARPPGAAPASCRVLRRVRPPDAECLSRSGPLPIVHYKCADQRTREASCGSEKHRNHDSFKTGSEGENQKGGKGKATRQNDGQNSDSRDQTYQEPNAPGKYR